MKALALIIFFILIPIAFSQNYRICSADNCQQSNDFPCFIQSLGLWCCSSNEFPHTNDCYGTKILFNEIPFAKFCDYKNYLGVNSNLNSLNITTNVGYDIIQYNEVEIDCNLNNKFFCTNITSPGLVVCTNSSPYFNFSGNNYLKCNISHPTVFILNSTFINFKPFNFSVRFDSTEIQSGISIIPIYLKSNSIIPSDFTLKLTALSKDVRIYEELKKTNTLRCKEEEKVSYIIETISPGIAKFNLLVKPNLDIPCLQDFDCQVFENGKCVDGKCWAFYDFSIEVKSKIPEFDYTYVYIFFLSILALIFILLLIEAIVRR